MSTTTTTTLDRAMSGGRSFHKALLAQKVRAGYSAWRLSPCHPIPQLGPGQVLVRTTHVALNPFDWQGVAYGFGVEQEAKVMGRDGAGVVIGVGAGVSRFEKGDRVWFCADSSRAGSAAFQEFSVHSQYNIAHTPPNLTDEQAATLGTGLITAGVTLFRTLRLDIEHLKPEPNPENQQWFLIWGGSGITGVFLIQLARHLGYRVICAASPGNFAYIRSLGAEVVLDRWGVGEDIVREVREATGDNVRLAVDNVGPVTAELCARVLQGSRAWRQSRLVSTTSSAAESSRLVPLAGYRPLSTSPDAVRSIDNLRISFSTTFYAEQNFARDLLDRLCTLLQSGRIAPARYTLVKGGLSGIEAGLDDLRHGRTKGGYKLIARISETPAVHETVDEAWVEEKQAKPVDVAVIVRSVQALALS